MACARVCSGELHLRHEAMKRIVCVCVCVVVLLVLEVVYTIFLARLC